MKHKFLPVLLFLCCQVIAQNKTITLENAVFATRDGIAPQRLNQLGWIKSTDNYYYVTKIDSVETLVSGAANSKSDPKKIVSLKELNEQIRHIGGKGVEELKTFPQITWTGPSSFIFDAGTMKGIFSMPSNRLLLQKKPNYPKDAANFDEHAETGYVAFTVENNLYFLKNEQAIQITNDAEKNIVNGQSVHRDEFGISKGTYWSPSGELLAFYRMDQTMVTDYPIIDLTQQPAGERLIKYPMAGGKSHEVTVGIYNTVTAKTVFLKTGEPKDQYLTNVAWSPDNKWVYIAILNRDQNHLWLNRYSVETGELDKTLFEETDLKYVHPMHPMQFVPGHDDEFIWQRQLVSKDNPQGLNAIYLYNTNGKLLSQISITDPSGNANMAEEVIDVYGFDPKGMFLYYQSAPDNTCEKQICAFDMKKGTRTVLMSNLKGTHAASFSDDRKYFLDTYSSLDVPGVQAVYDAVTGNQQNVLLTSKNPFDGYKQCRIKLFQLKAADGETPLWCRMIYPADFDSTKKYRTMTYVYNGPNVQLVTNSWMGGADFFLYYMAQQDFIIFTIDGRGSANRGMKFEQATFRHLGTQEIADQEKGAQYLKSLKYVDASRMAVFGWSFGGFMTTSLMTRTPDLFKCGVAGGPVIDWSYYEVMYTERYMDTPQTNPDGYKEASLFNYVGNLKGKLMLIHGTSDDVVVWQHSLLYIKACVDKGVQTDYYVYPGHPHNVRGKDRVHLLTKVSQYIMTNT